MSTDAFTAEAHVCRQCRKLETGLFAGLTIHVDERIPADSIAVGGLVFNLGVDLGHVPPEVAVFDPPHPGGPVRAKRGGRRPKAFTPAEVAPVVLEAEPRVHRLTGYSPGPYAHEACLAEAQRTWWATEDRPTPRSLGTTTPPADAACCFCRRAFRSGS